jgi:CubicO group peptidase (beta-lactamase class C family)
MRLAGTSRAAAGDGSIGLGWRVESTGTRWASGGSFGSTSFIGIAPQQHAAVVILSNVGLLFGNTSFDDVGLQVLAALAASKRGATP